MRQLFLFTCLGFIIGLISFNQTESDTYNKTENFKSKGYSEEEIKYFNEICTKSELNPTPRSPKKYKKDVKVFVYGNYEPFMLNEVKNIASDLNSIIEPIEISVIENRSDANMIIYFGDYESFIFENPDLKRIDKLKNCEGFYMTKTRGKNEIISSRILINIDKIEGLTDLLETIREEQTQALGFFADSWRYPNSCFYQGSNEVLKYSDLDVKLIKMLYNE